MLTNIGLRLEATNSWGDTYWGVCDGCGKNMLGKILMAVCKIVEDESTTFFAQNTEQHKTMRR